MILLIDNYDSFTYNILHLLYRFASEVELVQSDAISIDEIERMGPEAIVLSAGPGSPSNAGVMLPVVERLSSRIPTLGICLGMQVIAQGYGGRVVRAERVMQGKSSLIHHKGKGLFSCAASPMRVGRYHSLVVDQDHLPSELSIDAISECGVIMALSHTRHPVYGVQFHPESILTEGGEDLMRQFLVNL